MKAIVYTIITSIILVISFFTFTYKEKHIKTFKIGATTPGIHLLNYLKDDFEKAGLKVETIEFSDYNSPNLALARNRIDANFFQHKPFLEEFKKTNHLKLTGLSSIAIIPFAIYSKKYKSIKDIKLGSTIALPDDPTNLTRALLVLEDSKLVKLNHQKQDHITTDDIIENKKNLKFRLEEASKLPSLLDTVDATFINGNYAFINKLDPKKDSIYSEKVNSTYGNVIAIRTSDKYRKEIQILMKVIMSKKSKQFILDHSDEGIVPTF